MTFFNEFGEEQLELPFDDGFVQSTLLVVRRQQMLVVEQHQMLVDSQQDLPEDAARLLRENLWLLYD